MITYSEKELISKYEEWILMKLEEQENFSDFIGKIQSTYVKEKSDSDKIREIGQHITALHEKNRKFFFKYLAYPC